MRVIAKLDESAFPPRLSLYIHDAPHRRMHVAVIQQFRQALREACTQAGIFTPIQVPIDLYVHFVNPASPDLGNLYLALEQAMDGKTLRGPGIVADDSLIQKVVMGKFFPLASADVGKCDRSNLRVV